MKVLDRIRRLFIVDIDDPEQRASVERPSTPLNGSTLSAFWTSKAKSGAMVNVESILSLPAFWRAVSILGGVVASLPFNVIEEDSKGVTIKARRHPLYRVINSSPSPLYSSYKFRHTMIVHLLTQGNFYAWIRRESRTARVKELRILPPENVEAFMDERDNLFYKLKDSGKTFSADRILHISNTSYNGLAGLNLTNLHRENFGLALSNRDYGSNFYANGAHLSGVLKHPGRLTQDAYNRLRSTWAARYEGTDASGATAILEEGMDYAPVGLSPAEAAFIDTKKVTIADIARITGVPQFLLEDLDRATFNNIEHLAQLFVNYTIMPLCENIEAEFNRKLFFDEELGRYYTKFDFKALLRADTENRSKYIDALMKWGIINRDEARREEGYNPIEDGSGQAYYVPMNMVDPTKPEPGEQLNLFENEQEEDRAPEL